MFSLAYKISSHLIAFMMIRIPVASSQCKRFKYFSHITEVELDIHETAVRWTVENLEVLDESKSY